MMYRCCGCCRDDDAHDVFYGSGHTLPCGTNGCIGNDLTDRESAPEEEQQQERDLIADLESQRAEAIKVLLHLKAGLEMVRKTPNVYPRITPQGVMRFVDSALIALAFDADEQ